MNEIERDIYVKGNGNPVVIRYVQLTNAIPLVFHVRDYTVPSGVEARIYVKKPSGKEVYNTASISGNMVTVNPTTQMFAETGEQPGQVQIISGSKTLVTFQIIFDVERNIISESAIESTNEYTIIDQLIIDARTAVSAANSAASAANTAAGEANGAASAANTAAGKANTAAGAADTAAAGANKAATAANQSKEAADTAAKRANDAAKLCEDIASGQGWTEVLEKIEHIETALRNVIATE